MIRYLFINTFYPIVLTLFVGVRLLTYLLEESFRQVDGAILAIQKTVYVNERSLHITKSHPRAE